MTDVDQPADDASSAILPMDESQKTFHRFGDLPPEIRCTIWAMAWPTRLVFAYRSKPAPQHHCRSRQGCQVCKTLGWQLPVRAPAIMQACREARLEAQKISKPLSTWLWEIDLPWRLYHSWSRAQLEEYFNNSAYREEMLPVITHFNAKSDLITFDDNSIFRFSEIPGPFNHDDVFQAALDPGTTLLLFSGLLDRWVHPADSYELLQSGLRALCHQYLRIRTHVYISVGGLPPFNLTEEGWQKAIQEGLFSGHYEEARIVAANDEDLIRKYEALRHYCHQHIRPSRRVNLDQMLWSGRPNVWHNRRLTKRKDMDDATKSQFISNRLSASRENLSDAQLFMLQIADFLAWDLELGFDKGEEIMELDGHLKEDHPLVQHHSLRLPDFTPVLVFQALKPPVVDCSALLDRLPRMRTKFPEEDSSRGRLFFRRWGNGFLKRWGRSL